MTLRNVGTVSYVQVALARNDYKVATQILYNVSDVVQAQTPMWFASSGDMQLGSECDRNGVIINVHELHILAKGRRDSYAAICDTDRIGGLSIGGITLSENGICSNC